MLFFVIMYYILEKTRGRWSKINNSLGVPDYFKKGAWFSFCAFAKEINNLGQLRSEPFNDYLFNKMLTKCAYTKILNNYLYNNSEADDYPSTNWCERVPIIITLSYYRLSKLLLACHYLGSDMTDTLCKA